MYRRNQVSSYPDNEGNQIFFDYLENELQERFHISQGEKRGNLEFMGLKTSAYANVSILRYKRFT